MNLADDDFTIFDLPRRQAIDRDELDRRWRALQSEVHPDRFAAQGAAAQRLAMQWAVRVNEAYRRLRDPLQRAALLCELAGVPIDAERNTAMPPEFLLQQMAWREALDEATDHDAVAALERSVDDAEGSLTADLTRRLDTEADPVSAAADVRALMFVRRFRLDLEQRLERDDA